MIQNLESTPKVIHAFLKLLFTLFTIEVRVIHENTIIIFFLENECFTHSSSSLSFIYNIVVAISTPTTMNHQFQALSALKICFLLLLSHF